MRRVRVSPVEGQEIDPPSRQRIFVSATSIGSCPPWRQPTRRENTAIYLNDAEIVDQTPFLRQALRRRGVLPADLDDMVQETVLGAWRSMKAGRYRPSPNLTPRDALRAWLAGVVLRQASHYRQSATRRCEVLAVEPHALAQLVASSPERRIAARGLLRAFHGLRPELRDVLARAALGLQMHEIACELAIPQGTVATRLRMARRLFVRAASRRGPTRTVSR